MLPISNEKREPKAAHRRGCCQHDNRQGTIDNTQAKTDIRQSLNMNHRRQIDTRDGGPLPTSTTRTNQQSETQELPRQPSSLPQSMPHAGANSIQQLSFRRFNDNPNLTNHGVLQQGSQQPMTSYMTLQRPSQLQFLRPEQESSEQSMSTTMMTQPYSAGIRSFVGPSRLGHESQPFNICKSIPFPTANTAAVSQLVTGSSVFPCKSRGMTKDHNPQVSTEIDVELSKDPWGRFPIGSFYFLFFFFWSKDVCLLLTRSASFLYFSSHFNTGYAQNQTKPNT